MAIFNFPDTAGQPTDGSFVWTAPNGTLYAWDGDAWRTVSSGGGGGGDANISVTDDLTTIADPGQGDLAYHTVQARMYVHYEDEDSKQWVDASPAGDAGGGGNGTTKGGGEDLVFQENTMVCTANYTLTPDRSALSAGPITINDGVTISLPDNQNWVIL